MTLYMYIMGIIIIVQIEDHVCYYKNTTSYINFVYVLYIAIEYNGYL